MFHEARGAVFTVIGWLLLFGGWARVAVNGTMPTWPMAITPVLVGIVAAFVTSVWIRHNVSLHRRLGARRAAAVVVSHYGRDHLGRRIVGGHAPTAWSQACVQSTARRKRYLVID